MRSMVFKYGPPEPRHTPHWPPERPMIIKYGPPEPRPEIVDKYAPIEPNQPGVKPEDSRNEEIKAIIKQIDACLGEIKKTLKKAEAMTIVDINELDIQIAELNLLYWKLKYLQKSDGVPTTETKNRFFIAYIVTSPAKPKKD